METSGFAYHQRVSYDRAKMTGHHLDWGHQPTVYKEYPGGDLVLLPKDVSLPETRLSSLLKHPEIALAPTDMDLESLSGIFRLTYSLTAKARHSGGDFYYRNVASAGALYPVEIYVATAGVTHVQDGIHHFSIARHGLFPVRKGNFSASSGKAVEILDTRVPVLTFFLTAIFFRSAWKYRERSYRYHLLDAGHLLENLLLALKSLGFPNAVTLNFDDDGTNRLLGVDEEREVCLAICKTPGRAAYGGQGAEEINDPGDLIRNASRVSQKEIDYPAVREIHRAGVPVVQNSEPVPPMISLLCPVPEKWEPMDDPPDPWPEKEGYAEALFHRRSRRNFVKRPISRDCLTALLNGICASPDRGNGEDTPRPHPSLGVGFLVGNAEGCDPGFYLLDIGSRSQAQVRQGFLLDRMAHICLDQMWVARAAVHVVFLSNLQTVDRIWGPRGYRYAMMTAGQMGERVYLMAEAMGLGCCGIGAFYDTEAAALLGLNPASRLLYLVAVGHVKSNRIT
ncbi:MAG: SagB/ThcOx family dehydrogenase [Deltaproteobacteria bacterium]|nr:SagB/ThcOx family dehydrogenase [Deltaproteobacteria bacterium]